MNSPDELTPVEIEARFQALQAQRNEALDRCVYMQGKIIALQAELAKSKETEKEL